MDILLLCMWLKEQIPKRTTHEMQECSLGSYAEGTVQGVESISQGDVSTCQEDESTSQGDMKSRQGDESTSQEDESTCQGR